jgi:DNA helicase-2/ATP-dependent DNA helicase PcrA
LDIANETLRHNSAQFEKELVGIRPAGERPALVPCQSAREEAQYVAEQVLELRNTGTALANIAVLFRASSQSQQLELELIKRDVPYEYRGGQKFFERAHIKDIVSFLRVSHNPTDEPAWLRVLGLQTGIGATTASTLALHARTQGTFAQAIETDMVGMLPGKAREGWNDFCEIARPLVKEAPAPAAMIRAVAESRYQDMLEREYPNWRERLEDIEQFALFAEGYTDLTSFLADVSLYDDVLAKREAAGRGDDERMILSTVHQAKGLEWDTVFIIHAADGAFPNRRAMGEEGGLEEERRLFYVAVTRARRQLFLTYPLTMGFDALVLNRPSQFLDELPPRLLERIELVPSRGFSPYGHAPREHSWNWDSSEEGGHRDDVIELDRYGERRKSSPAPTSKTVWKKRPPTA